jgi:hypothetical protein
MLMLAQVGLVLAALALPSQTSHVDGTGEWDIIMMYNARTKAETIAVTSSGAIIQLNADGDPVVITARDHNCRAKPLILQVDGGRPVLLGEGGRRSVPYAMRLMLAGKQAVLAYYTEPCEAIQRAEIELAGLSQTLQKARKLPESERKSLEGQIQAEIEAAEKAEAEKRMSEDPSGELLSAARAGDVVHVIASLDSGADVNVATEGNGYTALIWAASRGYTETVLLLIEGGANLDLQAADGQTALMRSADNGHFDVVKILIESGADLNIQTDRGVTALRLATLKNHVRIIDLLTVSGAR